MHTHWWHEIHCGDICKVQPQSPCFSWMQIKETKVEDQSDALSQQTACTWRGQDVIDLRHSGSGRRRQKDNDDEEEANVPLSLHIFLKNTSPPHMRCFQFVIYYFCVSCFSHKGIYGRRTAIQLWLAVSCSKGTVPINSECVDCVINVMYMVMEYECNWTKPLEKLLNVLLNLMLVNDSLVTQCSSIIVVIDAMVEHKQKVLCECWCLLLTVGVIDWAQKKEQNLTLDISTMTKDIKKRRCNFVNNDVPYIILCFEAEMRCSWWVDAFRMKVPPFNAIFWPVHKIVHNSFKNQSIQIRVPLPKCTKSKVFRHVRL